jgi:hypothetical protein
MAGKKPLAPLIPLEQFKELVAGIARVPRDAIKKAKADRAKRKQGKAT